MSTVQKPSFSVNLVDWQKGANSYNSSRDQGILTDSVGYNVFYEPGLITVSPALGAAVTASLPVKGVISWGVGSGASAPTVMATMANASNHGYFYTVNPTTGAFTQSGSADTTRSFVTGITDTVFYFGKFYTSSETDITEHNADGTLSQASWWITTKGQSALTAGIPHPMLVYESIMYIADGRYLHKNDNGTVSTMAFDCPPDFIITSLVEFNGLIYMVAEPYKNLSGTFHGLSQMFSWDGLSDSWFEQYFLDYRVNCMRVYANQLFMWTNKLMGSWTGTVLKPMRPMSNQIFKHQVTAVSDSMVFSDGRTLVRYGVPFLPGGAYKFHNYMTSAALSFAGILSTSDDNLIMTELHASASPNYYLSNLNANTNTAATEVIFNYRKFKQPVKVRGIAIETKALTGTQKVRVGFMNEYGVKQYPSYNNGYFDNAQADMAGKLFFNFDVNDVKATRQVYPIIEFTGGVRVGNIDYFYEGSEDKGNK